MKCLRCYQETGDGREYHPACSKGIFSSKVPPEINISKDQIIELAKNIVKSNTSIPGVQKKLSADLHQMKNKQTRMTLVGLWGDYIIKPPTEQYPELPENEDCTMKIASTLGIDTVPHTLIRLKTGELAYLTKRIDRSKNKILYHMEDFCQISEIPTESKYKSSMEKIGKQLMKYATNSLYDMTRFYELSIGCFLTGNADMHLKNFSLVYKNHENINFAPAYDLVSTRLVIPEKLDPEEMALTVNGKKNKLKKIDFIKFGQKIELSDKQIENTFKRIAKKSKDVLAIIDDSFLSNDMKLEYKELFNKRLESLFG